jgi:small GTP-binding protein
LVAAAKSNVKKKRKAQRIDVDKKIKTRSFHCGSVQPLLLAMDCGELDIFEYLIEQQATVDASIDGLSGMDGNRLCLLHFACLRASRFPFAHTLIEMGAKVDAEDKYGWQPLHWAALKGHLNTCLLLLEKGANACAVDADGEQPLHKAQRGGHHEIIVLLQRHIAERIASAGALAAADSSSSSSIDSEQSASAADAMLDRSNDTIGDDDDGSIAAALLEMPQLLSPSSVPTTSVRVALLGAASTGKSCLLRRFISNDFDAHSYSTIGAARSLKTMKLGPLRYELELIDVGGASRYQSLAPVFYRGAHIIIVTFDITRQSTFALAKRWVTELHSTLPPHTIMVLAGNKSDLAAKSRQVRTELAQSFAKDYTLLYVETSARTGRHIFELFAYSLKVFDQVVGRYARTALPPPQTKKLFTQTPTWPCIVTDVRTAKCRDYRHASLYPPNARKKGYLTKQGHFIINWKRRWFVLKGDYLYYYKTMTDDMPAGVIYLRDCTVRHQHARSFATMASSLLSGGGASDASLFNGGAMAEADVGAGGAASSSSSSPPPPSMNAMTQQQQSPSPSSATLSGDTESTLDSPSSSELSNDIALPSSLQTMATTATFEIRPTSGSLHDSYTISADSVVEAQQWIDALESSRMESLQLRSSVPFSMACLSTRQHPAPLEPSSDRVLLELERSSSQAFNFFKDGGFWRSGTPLYSYPYAQPLRVLRAVDDDNVFFVLDDNGLRLRIADANNSNKLFGYLKQMLPASTQYGVMDHRSYLEAFLVAYSLACERLQVPMLRHVVREVVSCHRQHRPLSALTLDGVDATSRDIEALGFALATYPHCASVEIRNVALQASALYVLAAELVALRHISRLDLSSNRFVDGIEPLLALFRSRAAADSATLEHFSVANCQLSAAALAQLLDAVASCVGSATPASPSPLQSIDVSNNQSDSRAARSLARLIGVCSRNLVSLRCANIRLTQRALAPLLDALSRNTHLLQFIVDDSGLPEQQRSNITSLIARNRSRPGVHDQIVTYSNSSNNSNTLDEHSFVPL